MASKQAKSAQGQVRIRVQACGIFHSDVLVKEGMWPGIQYPRIPGHEVVGIVDELGAGVSEWNAGQRGGLGWHGGQDGTCLYCRRGDFRSCRNFKIPGISYDGGVLPFELFNHDDAVEPYIAGLVDVAHASLADGCQDFIRTEFIA